MLALVIGAAAAIQGASGDAALMPAAKWVLAYNQNDCTMSRSFGSGKDIVTLAVQPSADMTAGELVLLIPARGDRRVRRGKGRVTLSPSATSVGADWVSKPVGDGRLGIKIAVDLAFWDAIKSADGVAFEREEMLPIRLATGSMSGLTKALAACGVDLLRAWGIDPTLLRHVPPDEIARLFVADDYPRDAISAGEQGLVGTVVPVARDGRALGCRVVRSSGSSSLDQATCRKLATYQSRALIDPAAPDTRFVYVPVRWVLPSSPD